MIDWDRLATLQADIGEEDFTDVVFLFVAEITEHLDRLIESPATAVAGDFHFLRGSASNLGLEAMTAACGNAETACNAGQSPDLAGIQGIFLASIDAISTKVPGLKAAA